MATSSGGTGGGMDVTKDNFIPLFNNNPKDYKEWRSRITLYGKKMTLQSKYKEATINLLTSLSGVAWRQVEHSVEKLSDDATGFEKTLQILDAAFKYDSRVEAPRALENFFYNTSRRPEQTLLSYCTEHRERLREVEKHGIKVADSINGWLLLRRANLTAEQRQLVLAQCGEDTKVLKVEEVLYFLFGQDYKTKSWSRPQQSWNRYKPQRAYAAEEHDIPEDDEAYLQDDFIESPYVSDPNETMYYEYEESYDFEPYEEEAYETYDQSFTEEDEPDAEMEEAYSTYLDARKRFAEIRASRGYWPVVAAPPDGASTTASPPTPLTSSPTTKGKGKNKGKGKSYGRGKGRGAGQRPQAPRQGGKLGSRTSAAGYNLTCLKCGQPGHWAAQCPMGNSPSSRSTTTSPSKKARTDGQAMMAIGYVDKPKDVTTIRATIDTGASSVVIGHNPLMRVIEQLLQDGVPLDELRFRPANKVFHFGGDASSVASWSVHLPVKINGKNGLIQTFTVDGNTPFLIGRPILQFFAVKIDYQTDAISLENGDWTPAIRGPRGEYLLQLNQLDSPWTSSNVHFDLMTDETAEQIDERVGDDVATLQAYLESTQRTGPPELTFNVDEPDLEQDPGQQDQQELSGSPMDYAEDQTAVYRNITGKLMNTLHCQHTLARARQRQTIEQALRAHQRGTLMTWEVYSGKGNLAQAFRQLGHEVLVFDLHNGWDFTNAQHRQEFFELQRRCGPHFIWLAPPCTKWSPLQLLNVKDDARWEVLQCERDYEEHHHLRFTAKVFKQQLDTQSHAGVEQPKRAHSWKTKTFEKLDNKWFKADFDQCALGAWLPDENSIPTPILKPTTVALTDERLAYSLAIKCPGCLTHLPIEGSSPGIGNRAKASATYQPAMCAVIAGKIHRFLLKEAAFAAEDPPDQDQQHLPPDLPQPEHDEMQEQPSLQPPEPDQHQLESQIKQLVDQGLQRLPPSHLQEQPHSKQPTGVMKKLQPQSAGEALRIITRLHRNLGHPTNAQLRKLLQDHNANDKLLTALDSFNCPICHQRQRPVQVPKTGMYRGTFFNDKVQADTMWLSVSRDGSNRIPILVMSDTTTRMIAARLLPDEKSTSFIQAIERAWTSHFGMMNVLQVDEHRGWCSDQVLDWASENHVELQISPGKAHERLAILERRHQVVRRAIELFLFESKDYTNQGIITALNYVIPQINRQPNVHGYSPLQWTLGYTPTLPGSLTDEKLPPCSLMPTEAFKQKLEFQQQATLAISKASSDDRLRRALLRQYRGVMTILKLGDKCYYFRDLPPNQHSVGPKIVWRGPATIVMIEPELKVYWISHGASLIRASFEHVKPLPTSEPEDDAPRLDKAKRGLEEVRSRGTTRFLDLTKSNKRHLADIETDDEMFGPDDDTHGDGGLPDRPFGFKRTLSGATEEHIDKAARDSAEDQPPEDDDMYSPGTPLPSDAEVPESQDPFFQDLTIDNEAILPAPEPVIPSSQQPGDSSERQTVGSGGSHPTAQEIPDSTTTTTQEPVSASKAEPLIDGETFEQMRQRYDRQETQLYRPMRNPPGSAARRHQEAPYDAKVDEALQTDVDILNKSQLPTSWTIDEHGYMSLGPIEDDWLLQGNHLIRRHFVARDSTFQPDPTDCPVDLNFLQKGRDTFDGKLHSYDRWKHGQQRTRDTWTGQTRFKIAPNHRKEAAEQFYSATDGATVAPIKKRTDNISERHMSLSDKLAFAQAKRKELQSFFDNQV